MGTSVALCNAKDEADAQLALDLFSQAKVSQLIQSGVDAIHHEAMAAVLNTQIMNADVSKIDFVKGKRKQERMIAQYHVAGMVGGLVLNGHSAENMLVFMPNLGMVSISRRCLV